VISIVSIDSERDNPNVSTALSVVIRVGDSYVVSQSVQVCGVEKLKDCAARTFAGFDADVTSVYEAAAK
jgi:hypothetical protein